VCLTFTSASCVDDLLTGLGGDFVLVIKQEQPHQPRAWVETCVPADPHTHTWISGSDVNSLGCYGLVYLLDSW
jgi:hypothetical protein